MDLVKAMVDGQGVLNWAKHKSDVTDNDTWNIIKSDVRDYYKNSFNYVRWSPSSSGHLISLHLRRGEKGGTK